MARGELYLQGTGGDSGKKLHLAQNTDGGTLTTAATEFGAIGDITMTMANDPIIIPIYGGNAPMGINMNTIGSWTVAINTTWLDGIAGTALLAENFFRRVGFTDAMSPYKFVWGEKEIYVMLERFVVNQQGGHGNTLNISINLHVVASS